MIRVGVDSVRMEESGLREIVKKTGGLEGRDEIDDEGEGVEGTAGGGENRSNGSMK